MEKVIQNIPANLVGLELNPEVAMGPGGDSDSDPAVLLNMWLPNSFLN